jgi:hypothetical protein
MEEIRRVVLPILERSLFESKNGRLLKRWTIFSGSRPFPQCLGRRM